jgi:hypothetical protein
MASLLSPRRSDPEIALHATVASTEQTQILPADADLPRVSWPVAAVGGAWLTALCGWIVVTGVTVLGWLAADSASFAGAMSVGTQLWLLTNGSGVQLGASTVTLVPWGATLGSAYLISRLAAFAARQSRAQPLASVAQVTAVMVLAYALPVAGATLMLDGVDPTVRGTVSVAAVVALSAAWGSCRGLGYHPTHGWPGWCRPLPRAVVGAQLAVVAAGAAALVTGLVLHLDRVVALTDSLNTGVVGGIALWLVQLAFVPNAVVWAASYTLGAGFSLGSGSVIALSESSHGLLPSVPLLGALPAAGAGDQTQLWWLGAGVLAGGVAAWLALRGRPAVRFDLAALVGGLAGLLSGLAFVALAWASGGDLGVARLAGLGPRLLPLLVLSTATMGLTGVLVGLGAGLLRRPVRAQADPSGPSAS